MIHCPHCDIAFSPGYESCPKCGNFRTPREARREFCRRKAEEDADESTRDEVRAYLIENGFSDLEAEDVLDAAFGAAAARNRAHGCLRTTVGIAALILGAPLLAFSVWALCLNRFDEPMLKLGFVGIGLTIFGLLALMSGLWSTTTGK